MCLGRTSLESKTIPSVCLFSFHSFCFPRDQEGVRHGSKASPSEHHLFSPFQPPQKCAGSSSSAPPAPPPPFRAKECRRGRRSQGPRAPWNPFAAQTELGRTAAIRRIPHHGDAVDTAETQFGASNPTPWSFVAQHRRSHPTLMDQSTHQSTSSHAKWALNSGFHRPVHAPS